ncbi:MAG: hydantoinase B/oxoprolinase family protein [Actinobacteria bacterium]|nr:hydantoinase B/oxoprolinase family protein [Actinomycetota bacterium]
MKLKDPVGTEVIRHALETIAEEMRTSLYRTAMTVVVKDMLDYSCALFDARGHLVATALDIPSLLASMGSSLRAAIEKWGKDLHPGDVLMMNHPYMGGVHTSDINIFVPVFAGDKKLVGFAGTIAHHVDWGGRLPGTCATSNRSVFEEGVMYPAVKLVEAGVPNRGVYDIIAANVRNPSMNLGDLRAQVAAARTGERRLARLADRRGSGALTAAIEDLESYGAARTRARIAELPDGIFEAEGFLDDDGAVRGRPVRVHARIEIEGDRMVVDLSGSADQSIGAVNCPMATTRSAVHYAVKCLMADEVPFNEGCMQPVELIAPVGNLFNPHFPAATSVRHATSERLADVLTGALAKALPGFGSAGWFVGWTNFSCESRSPKHQDKVVLLANVAGGAGATPSHDGGSALDVHLANCAIIPAETVEMNYPLRVERYELIRDSGGAGRFRGGLGVRADYRVLGDEPIAFIAETEQANPDFAAAGIDGGQRGSAASMWIDRDGKVERLDDKGEVVVHPGEVVSMRAGGGGGFGQPHERSRSLVEADLRAGWISEEAAEAIYAHGSTGSASVEEATPPDR